MDQNTITELERHWEPDDGVFWKLREGILDTAGLERIAKLLEGFVVAEDAQFPRRFVSLVWFIPIFCEWQRERVQEQGGDMKDLAMWQDRLNGAVQRILGVP